MDQFVRSATLAVVSLEQFVPRNYMKETHNKQAGEILTQSLSLQ
jgi:hypothetical protein